MMPLVISRSILVITLISSELRVALVRSHCWLMINAGVTEGQA